MELILFLIWLMFAMGVVVGALLPIGWRFLRRFGARWVLIINPTTHEVDEEYRRPDGLEIKIGKGKEEKLVDLSKSQTYNHKKSGRPALIIDGEVGTHLAIDATTRQPIWPDGKDQAAFAANRDIRDFNQPDKKGINWTILGILGLLGIIISIGMLYLILTKIGTLAAGMNHG